MHEVLLKLKHFEAKFVRSTRYLKHRGTPSLTISAFQIPRKSVTPWLREDFEDILMEQRVLNSVKVCMPVKGVG